MKVMLLSSLAPLAERPEPLVLADRPDPEPGPGQVLVRVTACGVCHTDLDVIEGRTPPRALPLVLGHQVVGWVERVGAGTRRLDVGDRVGVAWIGGACGTCDWCRRGFENLCPEFRATGRDRDGGYAERMVVDAEFAHPLPAALDDVRTAPLLCAGAIGYRSLRLAALEDGQPLGLTGFGASGHLVLKLVRARFPATEVFVFARSEAERSFALTLGAAWAGEIGARPPRLLRAVIDTTPAWRPVVEALSVLEPAGRLVINAIRKEDRDREVLAAIDYARDLWMEKEVKSVANVTRSDVRELLGLAAQLDLQPEVETFGLAEANRALQAIRRGGQRGAKVLVME